MPASSSVKYMFVLIKCPVSSIIPTFFVFNNEKNFSTSPGSKSFSPGHHKFSKSTMTLSGIIWQTLLNTAAVAFNICSSLYLKSKVNTSSFPALETCHTKYSGCTDNAACKLLFMTLSHSSAFAAPP